jgi:uncharacterized protein (DUF1778 family)
MAKKAKPMNSSARMKAAGKIPSQVWLDPEQADAISRAAKADGRSVTNFLLNSGLAAAKKILDNSAQSHLT